jgi:lipopolysaccharide transport system permease protein
MNDISLESSTNTNQPPCSLVIKPSSKWWDLNLTEVWHYRDLLWMFVRRDFVAVYKQTILGPVWFFLQPLLTTIVYSVIFSGIANIPTDGLPPLLFYLAGTIPWNYFATSLTKTSSTFVSNASIFGKVYFPRLIVPLSIVLSSLIQFVIQFILLLVFFLFYYASGLLQQPNWATVVLLIPLLLTHLAILGFSTGIIVSSLTTKYRDMTFLVGFGVQLAMYATPIIYPMSLVPIKWRWVVELNPLSAPIESFRAIFLGGEIPVYGLFVSGLVTIVLLLLGIVIFNRVEKSFMDTV